jgi:hypothetical protein
MTISAIIAAIMSLVNGITSAVNSVFSYIRQTQLINLGRSQQQAEELKAQQEIVEKQDKILIEKITKEDVEKKLEKGGF